MYAIIETGGKQYKVREGDVIEIEKIASETKTIDRVLAIGGNGEATFGTPLVEGASVSIEIEGDIRSKKVTVFKMKRRKSYRRTQGHRQTYTVAKVTAINA